MSSTSTNMLTSEAFPTLGGGASPSVKKATAWSKPLSVKAATSEDQKVEAEKQGKESKIGEKAEEIIPAKNPQEDSDQEDAKSADSKPEEQELEQSTTAPWRKNFKPSGDESSVESKPWRTAPAEIKEDAPAPKIRPWHKTCSVAEAPSAHVEAGDEAGGEISRRPWKRSAAAPWRKSNVEETTPESEIEERLQTEQAKKEEEEQKEAEQAKKEEEEQQKAEKARKEEEQKAEQAKKEEEERQKAEQARKDEEERQMVEKAKKDEEERVQAERAKKDEEERKKAEKVKKDEEKEVRRKAYAEKFKALKEAEEIKEQAEKAMTSSMTSVSTVAPSSQRGDDSSVATEDSTSETEEPICRSMSVSPKRGSLTGLPTLAPGGKLTGSLTQSLTSLAPGRLQAAKKGNTFSVSSMLQWRAAAQAEELVDGNIIYRAEVLPEEELALLHSMSDTPKAKDSTEVVKERKPRREQESKGNEWRPLRREEPVILESSETSWAARQKQLREEKNRKGASKTDEEVVREMKSILNKLTIEKYDTLYQKMLSCGISTVDHVRILIHEVMEKATTQHHFIDMYAQFCSHLQDWFVNNKVSSDKETGFKRLLLNECQSAFERYLGPIDLSGLEGEALVAAQLKYKLTMLGNIKFVGALLQKKMLASSVLIGVSEELISEPSSPEALETLASFLTSVGGAFDREDWSHHKRFNVVFEKMQKKIKDKSVPARVRFLIQDVVDLRSTGWQDLKKATKKQEGPSKLADVEKKREAEEKGESLDGFMTVSR